MQKSFISFIHINYQFGQIANSRRNPRKNKTMENDRVRFVFENSHHFFSFKPFVMESIWERVVS